METRSGDSDLAAELRALRPTPPVTFADELDTRVAVGFVGIGEHEEGFLGRIGRAFRNMSPRQVMLPAGAVALTALVVATAVIAIGQEEPGSSGEVVRLSQNGADGFPAGEPADKQFSDTPSALSGGRPPGAEPAGGDREAAAGPSASAGAGFQLGGASGPSAATGRRNVERDAELVLRSVPGDIDADANEVFAVVHAVKGIVLNSSIHDWTADAGTRAGEARAGFELLIPTDRLGDTLASLSRIADVRSRHESTLDITAPTVGVAERVNDAEARIDGLVAQLAGAESSEERAAVETELGRERRQAAALRAQLDRLRERARFAHVSLRIESGTAAGGAGSGGWGVDDALADSGRILAITAGVAVIGLAVIGPLALIALFAWLAQRTLLRKRRERALS
jgi:hypothetical protein